MIKINERFEFERGDQCWSLHEWKDGINPKTKEPTRSKTTTYHSQLDHLCTAVIDRSAGDVESIQGVKDSIRESTTKLAAALFSMTE